MNLIDEATRILSPADYTRMPWKNGGGITHEVHAEPGAEGFDWRLSIAEVDRGGPFSLFPGIARTIMLLDGNGMRLTVEGSPAVTLAERHRPFDFDGGRNTHCELIAGAVRDFNIMSARARATHRATVHAQFPQRPDVPADTTALAVFCLQGECSVRIEAAGERLLGEHATLLMLQQPQRLQGLDGVRDDMRVLLVQFSVLAP